MSIQIPNPGTGNGATGDNEFVLWSKVKDNFSDQTNAASRLVGAGVGQVPAAEHSFAATYGQQATTPSASVTDFNNIPAGQRSTYVLGSIPNAPEPNGTWCVETQFIRGGSNSELLQIAYQVTSRPLLYIRTRAPNNVWRPWVNVSTNHYVSAILSSTAMVGLARVGVAYQSSAANLGIPASPDTDYIFTTYAGREDEARLYQIAYGIVTASSYIRLKPADGEYGSWRPIAANIGIYQNTTASGANVVVDSTGNLLRSTSSEQYKDILSPLELDDARYADAMALKPIVYRSTADADNPAYHYYSFSAEELGSYDPAFTLWRETETVTDADGNVTEQPLTERQAEGININALLAMSHAIAIKQGDLIKDLQEQINTLKPQTEV